MKHLSLPRDQSHNIDEVEEDIGPIKLVTELNPFVISETQIVAVKDLEYYYACLICPIKSIVLEESTNTAPLRSFSPIYDAT